MSKNPSSGRRTRRIRQIRKKPFKLALSSPIPGRPKVFWAQGSKPDIVIEFWLPGNEASLAQRGRRHVFDLNLPDKIVAYKKSEPHVRAVYRYATTPDRNRQILDGCLEWDGIMPSSKLKQSLGLLEEIHKFDWRGRPREEGVGRRIVELKKKGLSYARISRELDTKHGINMTSEAVRGLWRARKKEQPKLKQAKAVRRQAGRAGAIRPRDKAGWT